MGRNKTFHCKGEGGITGHEYYASTRLEVLQESIKAAKLYSEEVRWRQLTARGLRILGLDKKLTPKQFRLPSDVPAMRLLICTCQGRGCTVCNWSGLTNHNALEDFRKQGKGTG